MEDKKEAKKLKTLSVRTTSFYLPGSPVIHSELENEPWCLELVQLKPHQVISGALLQAQVRVPRVRCWATNYSDSYCFQAAVT